MRTIVRRWGNSLAIRIPREIAFDVGIAEGSQVDMTVQDGRILIVLDEPTD